MEGIYETNSDFDFSKLTLTTPTVMSGGNYFIKYLVNGAPLYIQPPKCKTKDGISKSGKRMYCDLVFTNENENFVRWMEDLENYTCNYIYKNREKWFETDMELPDIENYFTSPLKSYKSGKFYLARTNIGARLGKMSLKIYDESEEPVDPETIGENTSVITIIEVQGIKCSARSFQVEFEMKQMMVVRSNDDLFEKCLIGTFTEKKGKDSPSDLEKILEVPPEPHSVTESYSKDRGTNEGAVASVREVFDSTLETKKETFSEDKNQSVVECVSTLPVQRTDDEGLREHEINLDKVEESESIKIKPRNDVYYELYREARRKAKLARKYALSAYLDAKQIKNTYMLHDIQDSEESDNEEESLRV